MALKLVLNFRRRKQVLCFSADEEARLGRAARDAHSRASGPRCHRARYPQYRILDAEKSAKQRGTCKC
jgi:hypothetical protein